MMATDIRLFTRRPRSVLSPRDEGEHVVLADCRTKDLVYSSQMAYFNTTLDNSPEDIAVVKTAQGQTAVWFGQSTSALFTATGTTFKAVLNGTAEDGDFVGTGDNGYGTFYCYQNFYQDQYMYGDSTCNMVVDCNHRVPSATPTPSPSTTSSNALSTPAIIGISVGAGVACILLALASGYFLWRHYRPKPNAPTSAQDAERADHGHTTGHEEPKPADKDTPAQIHELAAYPQDNEPAYSPATEIDGVARAEVEFQPERFSFGDGGTNDFSGFRPPQIHETSPVLDKLDKLDKFDKPKADD